jgi:hypothetical protein
MELNRSTPRVVGWSVQGRDGGRRRGAGSTKAGAYLWWSGEVPARRVERAAADGCGSGRGEGLQKRRGSGRNVVAEARGQ